MNNYKSTDNYNTILEGFQVRARSVEESFQWDTEDEITWDDPGYTPKDVLNIMGDGACLYEDVLLSALQPSREDVTDTPFQGLEDTGTLELVVCRGDNVCAAVRIYPVSEGKEEYMSRETAARLPGLLFEDISHLISQYRYQIMSRPERLETLWELGCYDPDLYGILDIPKHLRDSFIVKLEKNLSEKEGHPVDLDELLAQAEQDPQGYKNGLAKLTYTLSDYQNSHRQQLSDRLKQAAESAGEYTLPTCSLTDAFKAIGLYDAAQLTYKEQLHLLQEKRMVFPSTRNLNCFSVKPSPFGRQCGLLRQIVLDAQGHMEREVRVLLPALEYFRQAMAYHLSHRVTQDEDISLSSRIQRLKSYMPSSIALQERLWPKTLAVIKNFLSTPAHTLLKHSEGPCDNSWMAITRVADLDRDHEQTSFLEIVSRLACHASDIEEINDPETDTHRAIQTLALMVTASNPVAENGIRLPLAQRVHANTRSLLYDVTLAEYLQAIAMLCESSYPLWIASVNYLFKMVEQLGLGPSDTLGKMLDTIEQRVPEKNRGLNRYLLLVQPLALLAPNPRQIPLNLKK